MQKKTTMVLLIAMMIGCTGIFAQSKFLTVKYNGQPISEGHKFDLNNPGKYTATVTLTDELREMDKITLRLQAYTSEGKASDLAYITEIKLEPFTSGFKAKYGSANELKFLAVAIDPAGKTFLTDGELNNPRAWEMLHSTYTHPGLTMGIQLRGWENKGFKTVKTYSGGGQRSQLEEDWAVTDLGTTPLMPLVRNKEDVAKIEKAKADKAAAADLKKQEQAKADAEAAASKALADEAYKEWSKASDSKQSIKAIHDEKSKTVRGVNIEYRKQLFEAFNTLYAHYASEYDQAKKDGKPQGQLDAAKKAHALGSKVQGMMENNEGKDLDKSLKGVSSPAEIEKILGL